MSKLTKEERQWLHDKFYGTDIGVSEDSFDYFLKEIEQKKKEWQKNSALKMLSYCREMSDGAISPMYLQSEKEFEQEFLEGSGIY